MFAPLGHLEAEEHDHVHFVNKGLCGSYSSKPDRTIASGLRAHTGRRVAAQIETPKGHFLGVRVSRELSVRR